MLQKTNMQPMASATSSKSELLFALYLYPVCVSTACSARQCQLLLGLDAVPEVGPQTRAQSRSGTEITAGIPSSWTIRGGFKGWSFTYRKQEMCQASLTVLWRRCPAAMLSPQPRHLQTSSPACSNKGTNSNWFTPEKTKTGTSFIKNNRKLSYWQESLPTWKAAGSL